MKRPAAAGNRLKSLAELKSVHTSMLRAAEAKPPAARAGSAARRAQDGSESAGLSAAAPDTPGAEADEFLQAMRGVTPLQVTRRPPAASHARPHPTQRERDNRAVLAESLADRIGVETLLDTDDT